MKKIILILTTLLLILILSLSLHKNKSQNTKVVVSEVTHSVFYAPWYAAIENGYFKDQNIDIEVLLTPGADKVATSVLSGDANIGFSGPEATVYIYNNSKQKFDLKNINFGGTPENPNDMDPIQNNPFNTPYKFDDEDAITSFGNNNNNNN